jgi:hypothetical protein
MEEFVILVLHFRNTKIGYSEEDGAGFMQDEFWLPKDIKQYKQAKKFFEEIIVENKNNLLFKPWGIITLVENRYFKEELEIININPKGITPYLVYRIKT